jgi:F0F1-type ATP synthase membrane subunit b/b'
MSPPNNTNIFVLYMVLIPLFVSILTLFYVYIIDFLRNREKQISRLISNDGEV